ncbi:hypothetical protein M9Y10_041350 [Tritrichomonas musculus]|uniref:Small GTP-binding protein n=1 Tax=Tritrichomonas musculus TaxID=1915356 RepID=A0ABR2K444_9EUKA
MDESPKSKIPKAKIVFIGNSSVGKTALFERLKKKTFISNTSPTISGACANINVELDSNVNITLMVWDTAGEESFRSIVPMYFSRAAFILIVYDITSPSSFDSIPEWFDLSKSKAPEWSKVIIIGNKSDLEDQRKVSLSDCDELCHKLGAFFSIETSAITGDGINDLLHYIASTVKEDAENAYEQSSMPIENKTGQKKCC